MSDNNTVNYLGLLKISSRSVLTKEIPDNWGELSSQDMDNYVERYCHDLLDGVNPNYLIEQIEIGAESLAYHLEENYEKRIVVEENLDRSTNY